MVSGCGVSTNFQAPNPYAKHYGRQVPKTGQFYIALIPFQLEVGQTHDSAVYREYIHTELTSPLELGEVYCGEMYVSFGDMVKASNNLGLLLTTEKINNDDYRPLIRDAQVVEKNVVTDTTNWVQIAGAFVADSSYSYLTLGNFAINQNTKFENSGIDGTWGGLRSEFSYYFIDDIAVYKIGDINDVTVSVSDTVVCPGEVIQLTANGHEEYSWSKLSFPGEVLGTEAKFEISLEKTPTFIVKARTCNTYMTSDTITIHVYDTEGYDLGNDTILCGEESKVYYLPSYYTDVFWSDGKNEHTNEFLAEGEFWYTANDQYGCSHSDTIVIKEIVPLPFLDLGEDLYTCEPINSIPNDIFDNYWLNGTTTEWPIILSESGEYIITVSIVCGQAEDNLQVLFTADMYFPNVFTPNEDEKNDVLIFSKEFYHGASLEVYNRWGQPVFETNDYLNNWGGEEVTDGTYFYYLTIPGCEPVKSWLYIVR